MSETLQHIVVLILVAGCVAWLVRGIVRAICQQRGGIGKCCDRGCDAGDTSTQAPAKPRVVFVPSENLLRKRR